MVKTLFQTLEVGSQEIRPVVCFFLSIFTMKTWIAMVDNVVKTAFIRRLGVDLHLLPILFRKDLNGEQYQQ